MKNRALSIDQLAVESFSTSAVDQQIGDVETGCVSGCATGCGFGDFPC